jgi:hypothetical protein
VQRGRDIFAAINMNVRYAKASDVYAGGKRKIDAAFTKGWAFTGFCKSKNSQAWVFREIGAPASGQLRAQVEQSPITQFFLIQMKLSLATSKTSFSPSTLNNVFANGLFVRHHYGSSQQNQYQLRKLIHGNDDGCRVVRRD